MWHTQQLQLRRQKKFPLLGILNHRTWIPRPKTWSKEPPNSTKQPPGEELEKSRAVVYQQEQGSRYILHIIPTFQNITAWHETPRCFSTLLSNYSFIFYSPNSLRSAILWSWEKRNTPVPQNQKQKDSAE